jgi:hypothetical protein
MEVIEGEILFHSISLGCYTLDEAYFLPASKGDSSCGKAMALLRHPPSLDELPISNTGLLNGNDRHATAQVSHTNVKFVKKNTAKS